MVGGIVLILTMNSLVMSVFERTGEIGTMRAIGAPRGFIRGLFVVETGALTMLSALAGILLGSAGVALLDRAPLQFNNQILVLLFGGAALHPSISGSNILVSVLAALVLRNRCLGIPGSTGTSYPARARDSDGMRASMTLLIAFRNFTRNGRRFLLLGLAVTAGFFFVCTVQSLVAGLSYQISTRGARYYGGHVIVSRAQGSPADMTNAQQDRFVLDAIEHAGVRSAAISHRTHFGADGVIYYNGEAVRIRRVIGMDWTTEGRKISELQFVSGRPEDMSDPRGALISEVTARRMGARVGDLITLQVNREGGAINTLPLLVKAIFREVSIFGYYTVYMDRAVLDQALGFDARYSATVGLYLKDYRSAGSVAARLSKALAGRFTAQPVVSFMPEIRTMLSALTLVSYGILRAPFDRDRGRNPEPLPGDHLRAHSGNRHHACHRHPEAPGPQHHSLRGPFSLRVQYCRGAGAQLSGSLCGFPRPFRTVPQALTYSSTAGI